VGALFLAILQNVKRLAKKKSPQDAGFKKVEVAGVEPAS
jgi:hypothetical protein